jgi:WD40 repeat protein
MITAYDMPMDNSSIPVPNTDCVAWNPAQNLLASGGTQGVQIWNAAKGRRELVLGERLGYVNAIAWGPDGKRLASGGRDGVVSVWDLAFPVK